MRITKLGHSTLLVEEKQARFLIDPGTYAAIPDSIHPDAILITHQHPDHFHVDTIRILMKSNPAPLIVTQEAVKKLLEEAGISSTMIADKEEIVIKDVSIRGYGTDHACLHKDLPLTQNRGYLIAGRLFHPGDALHDPRVNVEILALPVAGPWLKLDEVLEYAKALRPATVFPIHDGMIRDDRRGALAVLPKLILEKTPIRYHEMGEGSVLEF